MELTWIITAILGILLMYLLYSLSKKSTNYWTERGVPQVKNALPLFGHMLSVISGRNTLIERINSMYKELDGKKFGGYYMFTNPMLIIRDPEIINQVCIKDFSNFEDRNYAMDEKLELMSAGLANLTGDKWRVLRHKLTPTFTSGKLKMMFREIKECSGDVVNFLNGKKGKDIDTRDLLFKYTINVTGSTAFGMKVDALNEETEKSNLFLQNSKDFFAPSLIMQLKLLIAFAAPKVKDFLKLSLANQSANEFFPKIVQDLIKYRKENGTRRNDFLQLMLDQKEKELSYITSVEHSEETTQVLTQEEDDNVAEEPDDLELLHHLKNLKFDKTSAVFSDHTIAAQTFLFISGGTETTSAVLSFALYELAVNKDIQKRLQDEIDSVLVCDGFTYESIKKMTYLEQVINEILRLRPPGGILSRVCTQDYKIQGTEVVIPKGVLIHVPVQAIHKDAQYFPDPETFNPDRFQDMDAIPKNVYFPFGSGPRICLAMRLAMLEMKIFLADVLSNYNIVLSERTQTPLILNKKSILQHVIGGIWVRFESRNTSRK